MRMHVCVSTSLRVRMRCSSVGESQIQGGEDPMDVLSCRSFLGKRATNYRALLRKVTYNDKLF